MGISLHPCKVTMPPERTDCPTVLDFLIRRFSKVDETIWRQRMAEGKIHWEDKTPITADDAYVPHARIFYYREVEQEPVIPFQETILYQDDEILVACKPHLLPVTPKGIYVEECLLSRLQKRTGIETLAPMHRIDRETAGVVLFSVNPKTRHLYHKLFLEDGLIRKSYRAVGRVLAESAPTVGQTWNIANRMVPAEQWFRMTTEPGEVNARSTIRCIAIGDGAALFALSPLTGKTHQLRLHMSGLGFPLMNDRLYPELQPKSPDNFEKPLQLLAYELAFTDPVTGIEHLFTSSRDLEFTQQKML